MGLLFSNSGAPLTQNVSGGSEGLDMDLKAFDQPWVRHESGYHTPSYFKVKAKTGIFKKS
jgi:hypothetical protein